MMPSQTSHSFRAAVLSLALVALVGFAPRQDEWKRVRVGNTPVSMEIPGTKFKPGEVERSQAQGDWVATSQDFDFDNDDYFVRVTVYKGRPGTKVDNSFIKTRLASILKELDGNKPGPKEVESSNLDIADHPAHRGVYSVHPDKADDNYVVRLTMIGDGDTLYVTTVVSYPSIKSGTESAEKTHKSVEFKPAK